MWIRRTREPTAYDDDLTDSPAEGGFFKWGLGMLAALAVAFYGVWVLVSGDGTFSGRTVSIDLHGFNAAAYGVAAIAIGVFLHCHYFWGNIYDNAWGAVLGKIISAATFIVAAVTLFVRVGVLGRH